MEVDFKRFKNSSTHLLKNDNFTLVLVGTFNEPNEFCNTLVVADPGLIDRGREGAGAITQMLCMHVHVYSLYVCVCVRNECQV